MNITDGVGQGQLGTIPSQERAQTEDVQQPVDAQGDATQLTLMDCEGPGNLDDRTREIGRKGLAFARQSLANTAQPTAPIRW